jgi:hypothetical protein
MLNDFFNIRDRLNRTTTASSTVSIVTDTSYDCLNDYRKRLLKMGFTGDPTTTFISEMETSFLDALANSPNTEEVFIINDTPGSPTPSKQLAIITQSKNPSWDRDVKDLAMTRDSGADVGKTVDWIRTDSKYLVTSQNLTQKAYFSGTMEQCNFLLNWSQVIAATTSSPTATVVYSQYVVVDGPKEKEDDFKKFFGLSVDEGAGILLLLIGKTEGVKYLNRYDRIILNNQAWEIAIINDMENENIIRLALKESFINKDLDNTINSVANNTQPAVGELRSLILGDL